MLNICVDFVHQAHVPVISNARCALTSSDVAFLSPVIVSNDECSNLSFSFHFVFSSIRDVTSIKFFGGMSEVALGKLLNCLSVTFFLVSVVDHKSSVQ